MSYKRNNFDRIRLHGGGLALVFMLANVVMAGDYLRAVLLALALAVFLKLEGSLEKE